MDQMIHIGIGQMRIAQQPARLICLGLGSCVAIAIWDPSTKIGGMAHVMLPDESFSPRKIESPPAKFGATAVRALLDQMRKGGANIYCAVAKIAGGANMFRNVSPGMKDIGLENVKAVKKALAQNHVRMVAEDVGGNSGRTVELDTRNGSLTIKTVRGVMKVI